jgi:periplasmic protein CpxP/Spy
MILSFKRGHFGLLLVTISLINFLSISNTQSVSAQTSDKKPRVKRTQFMSELRLTDTQQKQIMAIRNKYQNSFDQRREALKTTEDELQQLMIGNSSVEAIHAKHSEFRRIIEELENLRFNMMLEIRELLTPAQRVQIAQIINKQRQKFHQTMNRPPEF